MKHVQATFITGYVTIMVKGQMPEIFFQQCVDHDIPIWNVKRVNPKQCEGNIRLQDIRQMRKIRRGTGYKITFSRKKDCLLCSSVFGEKGTCCRNVAKRTVNPAAFQYFVES
ncbi:sporulation protein YqfD [Virgibacillus sp. 179-BFC.A HS]|uniref:Sporulation protein YqfD n=1 Tax=Tigheibacillus jepli TaxID=3035914 RepID=A0ABU5CJ50_9BACI|nr:sporulation protein YqfD [Virgibacillus sp. 179-BFC.A HS]MDY0405535.1 sporulation protein YqfD [Virgibacillus sp. 179-BFC.A HS]